jgi:ubiquinone/menaquinone biosynthesis C-methylase UbiE
MSEQERWQVDSNAPDAYERHLVPTLFAPWAHDLLSRVTPQLGERVVDVACGTGIVARLAAAQVGLNGRVVGIDLNRGMLDVAGTQTKSSGATVEWCEGDVNALPCDNATFDVAFCQQGLQFFPDKVAALGEIYRVLAPGGHFALSAWRALSHNPYLRLLGDALEKHISPEAANGYRAACDLGDAETLRDLLTGAGFEDVHISIVIVTMRHSSLATFIPGQLAATPWAGAVAALDATAQSALLDDIITAFQPYTDDDGLAVPTESHVFVARK